MVFNILNIQTLYECVPTILHINHITITPKTTTYFLRYTCTYSYTHTYSLTSSFGYKSFIFQYFMIQVFMIFSCNFPFLLFCVSDALTEFFFAIVVEWQKKMSWCYKYLTIPLLTNIWKCPIQFHSILRIIIELN